MKLNIAFFLSHPTQHHAPWFQRLAQREDVEFKAFFMSRAGVKEALDREFNLTLKWDIPLTEGYEHEFLPPLPPLSDDYLGPALANRNLLKALRERPWHAVCNTSYSYPTNWLVWAAALALGIPQVFHSDSTLLQPRARWRVLFKEIPVRTFLKGMAVFLASGDNNVEYLKRYGAPLEKISFCPIPVDLSRFQEIESRPDYEEKKREIRKRFRIPEEAKVVVFCGKLVPRKRPEDLVRALQRKSLEDVYALFIGAGPLEENLKKAGERFKVTGFVNQKEIPYHLGVGELLVMPSEWDPHPIVVTEAACLGLPAVISNQCGCYGPNDVLRPGENGFVYPCGNVESLASCIAKLLNDDDLRKAMSKRARELAQTQDASVAAERLVEAVKRLYS